MAKKTTRVQKKQQKKSTVYFGSAKVDKLNRDATLPGKLARILKRFDLKHLCQGARVPIKMHLGGGLGYSTIHPVFLRQVVDAVKNAGGEPFLVDSTFGGVQQASARGYTEHVVGCPVVAGGGPYDSHITRKKIGYRALDEVELLGAIYDAPCLINFSHVKGHGACAYGGACKNIAMGCVTSKTRGKIHSLEGGIDWTKAKCTFCGRCVEACDTDAVRLDPKGKTVAIFYHHCRYCRHCVNACPQGALVMRDASGFKHFQEAMARTTRAMMKSFDPSRVLHLNLLIDITMFCDCWGMTTPSVVPDVGVMASHDMVAIETASIDAVKIEDLIPGSLIGDQKLVAGKTLWERLHGKDPLVQVRALQRCGLGTMDYKLAEVK